MLYIFFLLCFQMCLLFSMYQPADLEYSMSGTVNLFLNTFGMEEPKFDATSMLEFFNSPQLKQYTNEITIATNNSIEILKSNGITYENTVKIMREKTYQHNITTLATNKEIRNMLTLCLQPIPKPYMETSDRFKTFWYKLWKNIIPREYFLQKPIDTDMKDSVNYLLSHREYFLSIFPQPTTLITEIICDKLTKLSCDLNTFAHSMQDNNCALIYQDMALFVYNTIPVLVAMFDKILYKSKTKKKTPTYQESYSQYNSIPPAWRSFWQSSLPEEKEASLQTFKDALTNYTTFLQKKLYPIPKFNK